MVLLIKKNLIISETIIEDCNDLQKNPIQIPIDLNISSKS